MSFTVLTRDFPLWTYSRMMLGTGFTLRAKRFATSEGEESGADICVDYIFLRKLFVTFFLFFARGASSMHRIDVSFCEFAVCLLFHARVHFLSFCSCGRTGFSLSFLSAFCPRRPLCWRRCSWHAPQMRRRLLPLLFLLLLLLPTPRCHRAAPRSRWWCWRLFRSGRGPYLLRGGGIMLLFVAVSGGAAGRTTAGRRLPHHRADHLVVVLLRAAGVAYLQEAAAEAKKLACAGRCAYCLPATARLLLLLLLLLCRSVAGGWRGWRLPGLVPASLLRSAAACRVLHDAHDAAAARPPPPRAQRAPPPAPLARTNEDHFPALDPDARPTPARLARRPAPRRRPPRDNN